MKIESRNEITVTVDELDYGDAFFCDGYVYIKIDPGEWDVSCDIYDDALDRFAVCVSDGELVGISGDYTVSRAEAKLVIE